MSSQNQDKSPLSHLKTQRLHYKPVFSPQRQRGNPTSWQGHHRGSWKGNKTHIHITGEKQNQHWQERLCWELLLSCFYSDGTKTPSTLLVAETTCFSHKFINGTEIIWSMNCGRDRIVHRFAHSKGPFGMKSCLICFIKHTLTRMTPSNIQKRGGSKQSVVITNLFLASYAPLTLRGGTWGVPSHMCNLSSMFWVWTKVSLQLDVTSIPPHETSRRHSDVIEGGVCCVTQLFNQLR